MLEEITQKVDRNAVQHTDGEKVARSFADRPTAKVIPDQDEEDQPGLKDVMQR